MKIRLAMLNDAHQFNQAIGYRLTRNQAFNPCPLV